MTWAVMCRFERNTARRGRSAVPRTFLRTRRWRRIRASRFCLAIAHGRPTSPVFPALRATYSPQVAHALALVGLGLADRPDVGGDLADHLLVDALHHDAGRRRHLEGDAVGGVDLHRVAEAERQLEASLPWQRGAVADADDLELLAEAVGDADDHVVDQRADQAVQGPVLALVVGPLDEELGRRPGGR